MTLLQARLIPMLAPVAAVVLTARLRLRLQLVLLAAAAVIKVASVPIAKVASVHLLTRLQRSASPALCLAVIVVGVALAPLHLQREAWGDHRALEATPLHRAPLRAITTVITTAASASR